MLKAFGRKLASLFRFVTLVAVATATLAALFVALDALLLPGDSEGPPA